jgi:hypothetical protein
MIGFIEIIILLLGMAGFGLAPNPKAATPDQALHYAVADADIVAHVDVASVVPGNYKALLALPKQPQIKASPELAKMVQKLVTEVEGARGIAKTTTGIDLTTDITDATLFLKIVPNSEPEFVAAVRGKLSAQVLDKIARVTNKQVVKVGAGAMLDMGNEPAIAITGDGVMLAGTPRLVRERLAPAWRPPARPATSQLGYAQTVLSGRPVFSVVVALSQTARKELSNQLGSKKNFLTDLAARHRVFAMAAYHDGLGWTWVDRDKAGLDQMAMMSEGTIEVMRAAQIAPRGVARVLLGALESYKGTDRRVDEVLRRRADILKIVDGFTGDGNFKVKLDRDPRTLRLDVRLTAKSLSEVLPAGLLLPGFAAGLWFSRAESSVAYPPPPMPAQGGGLKPPAKKHAPPPPVRRP